MKEFRVILLAFFTLIAARMMSELPSCPSGLSFLCGNGLIIITAFLLSTYFVDSLISTMTSEDQETKTKLVTLALCTPYILITGFVIVAFFNSVSAVTIEYILSFKTIYAAIIYVLIYTINNLAIVRKVNSAFMVSLILSFVIFLFI